MKKQKHLDVVWQAVTGIIRSQKVYDTAVEAVASICNGDGSLFGERVYAPLFEKWIAINPPPAAIGREATRSAKAEHALSLREHEQARRNFQAALSYLKLRAGLRIKRTGARGKAKGEAKAPSSKPVIPLSGKVTAGTITGMLRSIMAATGWSLETLEGKLALAVTELRSEEGQ